MMDNSEPCIPVISILAPAHSEGIQAMNYCQQQWEQLHITCPPYLFDQTNYYEEEIGYPLLRWWGYRDTLANPAQLVEWKKTCIQMEDNLRDSDGDRTVNLDPGYLNYGLLVLGSHKYELQKIYLGDGVYADPVLEYGEGRFQSFHWSFPDFKEDLYYPTLNKIRTQYKKLRQK
ncbi:MAG: DUF4416 family protein [bacterium]